MLRTIIVVVVVYYCYSQQVTSPKMILEACQHLETKFGLQKQNYLGLRASKQIDDMTIQLTVEYSPNRLFMVEFRKQGDEDKYVFVKSQYVRNSKLQMRMFVTAMPISAYIPHAIGPYGPSKKIKYQQGQSVQDMIRMNQNQQQKNRQPIVNQFGINQQQQQSAYFPNNPYNNVWGFRSSIANTNNNQFSRTNVIMSAVNGDGNDNDNDDEQKKRAESVKYEDLTDGYDAKNRTLYPQNAQCDLGKMYENLEIKFKNRPIKFLIKYDDESRTIAKVIEYINERNMIQKDLRKQRRDIQRDIDQKLGQFLFQDSKLIDQSRKDFYSNITQLKKTVFNKYQEKDDKLVGNIQKFMETVFLESKFFQKTMKIEKKKNGFEDQLGKYFYDYLFSREDKEIEEDIKVIFVVKDDLLDGVEQTIEYSMNDKNTTRYVDIQQQVLDIGKEDLEITNYNHIPASGYNLTTDLEYLKFHNKSVISTIIKQNKRSEMDAIKYDFSRVINVTGYNLVDVFANNSLDDFNTFLISYYQKQLQTEKVDYEVKQNFTDVKSLKYYFGENGVQFFKSIYQNLFDNFQLLDFVSEQISKNPFNSSSKEKEEKEEKEDVIDVESTDMDSTEAQN